MTDRDYFAVAALIRGMGVLGCEQIAKTCYGMADVMLRERERHHIPDAGKMVETPTNRDAAPEARDHTDADRHREEPVGWVVIIPLGGKRFVVDDFFVSEGEAQKACKWRIENTQRGAEVIPLHRSPTLTDAEREAVENAAYFLRQSDEAGLRCAATLLGLLERLAQKPPQ